MKTFTKFALLFVGGVTAALSQVPEPSFNDVFYAIDASTGKLVELERQTVSFNAKIRFGGFGGFKATTQIKNSKSPVRLDSNAEFIVRSAVTSTFGTDPNSVYTLRAVSVKGNKRESLFSDAGGMFSGRATTDLNEGSVRIRFERYGAASLKVTTETPLPPGEYTLSLRGPAPDVFCFGVDR